jgi:uncharacterized membrane protein YvbJ
MNNCPKCRAANNDDAKFCQTCGAAMTESMASKAAGVAATHAKKIGDQAKRTAEYELHSGVNNVVNKVIRGIFSKIFGK